MYAKYVFDGFDYLLRLRFVKIADDVSRIATSKLVIEVGKHMLDVGNKRAFKVVAIVALQVNFGIAYDKYLHLLNSHCFA